MKKGEKKQNSIKHQLIKKNALVIIIASIVFVVIGSLVGRSALLNNSKELLSNFAKQVGEDISRVVELETTKIEVIAETPILKDENISEEEKFTYLRTIVNNQGYKKAAIIDLNGVCRTILDETTDVSDKEYFKENLAGKSYFTAPNVSKADGGLQISITVPLYNNNGNMIGILFFSKDAEEFCEITNNIRFGATGTAYVVDSTGTNIMNNDIEKVKEKVNRIEDAKTDSAYEQLAEITKKMIAGEVGTGEYSFKGSKKFLGYAPVEATGWSVGVTTNMSDMLSGLKSLIFLLSVVGILILIFMILFTYKIASVLAGRLGRLKTEVEEIATGNFETKEINDKTNDEITAIYESLENTKDAVGKMIGVIKNTTKFVNEESNELARISEIFIEGTGNINNAIEQSSKATESQAAELTDINLILNEFDIKMNESSKSIENISNMSLDISEKANGSCEDMDNLSKFMDVLNESFTSFAKEINEMKTAMETINDITKLISDISDQTNLLALNAAIEAARAGEAGKGFSVVADEIGTLAEQSKESTSNINDVISQVINKAESIANTSDKITLELASGEKNVENSITSFEGILNNVTEVTSMIKNISDNFKQIIDQKDEIIEKVEEASAVSEEMVATSEEISASTMEFVSSTTEIKDANEKLAELTSNMEEAVNQFKI